VLVFLGQQPSAHVERAQHRDAALNEHRAGPVELRVPEQANQGTDQPGALQAANLPAAARRAQEANGDQRDDDNEAAEKEGRVGRYRLAPAQQQLRCEWQFLAGAFQQHREARHHDAQQEEHDQGSDEQQQRRVDRGPHELAAQHPHRFQVCAEAPQRRHQVAGLFARRDGRHQQRREQVAAVAKGRRQRHPFDHVARDRLERLAAGRIALLLGEGAQRVHHPQAGVEQRGQLVGEKPDVQAPAAKALPTRGTDFTARQHAQSAQLQLLAGLARIGGAQPFGQQRPLRRNRHHLEQELSAVAHKRRIGLRLATGS